MQVEMIKVVSAKFNNSGGSTKLLREVNDEPLVASLMKAFKDGDELVIMRKDDWLGTSHGTMPKQDNEKALQLLLLAREKAEQDKPLSNEIDNVLSRVVVNKG